jgi:hypothetical protein
MGSTKKMVNVGDLFKGRGRLEWEGEVPDGMITGAELIVRQGRVRMDGLVRVLRASAVEVAEERLWSGSHDISDFSL